jgi:hypothetical protein
MGCQLQLINNSDDPCETETTACMGASDCAAIVQAWEASGGSIDVPACSANTECNAWMRCWQASGGSPSSGGPGRPACVWYEDEGPMATCVITASLQSTVPGGNRNSEAWVGARSYLVECGSSEGSDSSGSCSFLSDGECDVPTKCPQGTDLVDCGTIPDVGGYLTAIASTTLHVPRHINCMYEGDGARAMCQPVAKVEGARTYLVECCTDRSCIVGSNCNYERDGECDVPAKCQEGTDLIDCGSGGGSDDFVICLSGSSTPGWVDSGGGTLEHLAATGAQVELNGNNANGVCLWGGSYEGLDTGRMGGALLMVDSAVFVEIRESHFVRCKAPSVGSPPPAPIDCCHDTPLRASRLHRLTWRRWPACRRCHLEAAGPSL